MIAIGRASLRTRRPVSDYWATPEKKKPRFTAEREGATLDIGTGGTPFIFSFTSPRKYAENNKRSFQMSNLMCRPELHDATTREQYTAFHAEMEQLGLEQTVTRDGEVFRLPTGLYLGVNVSTPPGLLSIRISLLAIRITGCAGKIAVWPIDSPASISILGLEDVTPSYGSLLGLLSGPPMPPFDLMTFWSNKTL